LALCQGYGNLKNTIKSKDVIAAEFGAVNHTYLPSWLQSIAQIRNYAPIIRDYGIKLTGSPKLLSNPPFYGLLMSHNSMNFKIIRAFCIMKYLLNIIQPENNLTEKIGRSLYKILKC
jgi:abortive infection bacteriophage resistance protein